ncbi:MAG: hypothetical protein KO540_12255, partial [Pseudomonas indica]|nr:hypothetical protein [Pseudomonas indica]
QELWGVLLGYNLLRYQMLEMSRHCPGIYPCEMSFTACTWAILGLLNGLSLRHPGTSPNTWQNCMRQPCITCCRIGGRIGVTPERSGQKPPSIRPEIKMPVSLTDWH